MLWPDQTRESVAQPCWLQPLSRKISKITSDVSCFKTPSLSLISGLNLPKVLSIQPLKTGIQFLVYQFGSSACGVGFFPLVSKKGKAFETLAFNLSNFWTIFHVKSGDINYYGLIWGFTALQLLAGWPTAFALKYRGWCRAFSWSRCHVPVWSEKTACAAGGILCLCVVGISGFMTADAFNPLARLLCANIWIIWFTSSAVHKWISELEVLV